MEGYWETYEEALKTIEEGVRPRHMSERKMYRAVCSDCGRECEVPFKPDPNRPVYCRECWEKRRGRRRRF